MYNKDFLNRMAIKASKDKSVFVYTHKKEVIVTSIKTGKRAVAKCHKNDEWNFATGLGIAYCRLKNIPIKQERQKEVLVIYRLGKTDTYLLWIGNDLFFKVKPRKNDFWEVIPYESVVKISKNSPLYNSLKWIGIDHHPKLKFNYCPPRENLEYLGISTLRSSAFNVTFKYPYSIVIFSKAENRTCAFTPLDNLTEIENVGYGYSLFKGYPSCISMSHPIFIYEDKYYEWWYDERTEQIVSIKK